MRLQQEDRGCCGKKGRAVAAAAIKRRRDGQPAVGGPVVGRVGHARYRTRTVGSRTAGSGSARSPGMPPQPGWPCQSLASRVPTLPTVPTCMYIKCRSIGSRLSTSTGDTRPVCPLWTGVFSHWPMPNMYAGICHDSWISARACLGR